MTHHKDLIRRASAEAIQRVTGVSIHTVRSWAQRNSIPGEYWKVLADAGHASLDELATAAAQKGELTPIEAGRAA